MGGLVERNAAFQLLFADVTPWADVVGGDGDVEVRHSAEVGSQNNAVDEGGGKCVERGLLRYFEYFDLACVKTNIVDYQSFAIFLGRIARWRHVGHLVADSSPTAVVYGGCNVRRKIAMHY